jgi:hypothetical protein
LMLFSRTYFWICSVLISSSSMSKFSMTMAMKRLSTTSRCLRYLISIDLKRRLKWVYLQCPTK